MEITHNRRWSWASKQTVLFIFGISWYNKPTWNVGRTWEKPVNHSPLACDLQAFYKIQKTVNEPITEHVVPRDIIMLIVPYVVIYVCVHEWIITCDASKEHSIFCPFPVFCLCISAAIIEPCANNPVVRSVTATPTLQGLPSYENITNKLISSNITFSEFHSYSATTIFQSPYQRMETTQK